MLSNQTFVDPHIASRIKQLQQQMKSLLQQKLHIQYNTQFIDEKRRIQLLKANQQQRLELRKFIEKSKLCMVEYLDRQVEVVAVQSVRKGKVERRSKDKFDVNKLIKREKKGKQEQKQGQEQINQDCKHSRQSESTNYKSKVYVNNDKSLQYLNSFHDESSNERTEQNCQQGWESCLRQQEDKQRKSCMSTGCRSNKYRLDSRGKSKVKASCELNGSLIQNKNNGSSIMQINQFNITTTSIPAVASVQQSLPNAKSSLLHYLNQQPAITQSHSQLNQLTSLFQAKISCLQQKCLSLQTKNSQLLQIIDYQESTIQELDYIIMEKDKEIIQWQKMWETQKVDAKSYQNGFKLETMKLQQCGFKVEDIMGDLILVIKDIERYKDRLSLNLKTNQIISKYRSILSPESNYLPITLQSNLQQQKSTNQQKLIVQSQKHIQPNYEPNILPNHLQEQKIEITSLGRQLVELQITLKQIQEQNDQLKGERRLLLKKIKI